MTKKDMMLTDSELDNVVGGITCLIMKEPSTGRFYALKFNSKADAAKYSSIEEFKKQCNASKASGASGKLCNLDKYVGVLKKNRFDVVFLN